ncbi:MAG TPA: DUF4157 domain-containing protein [Chitinophaga sp.]
MQQQAIKQPPKAVHVTKDEGMKLHRKCGCNHKTAAEGECEECKKKRETKLQRAPANAHQGAEVPEQVYEVLQSPGHPLDPAIRRFMEPRFDHDFSRVRVHTDARAGESARAVNALAYTVGRDIVFGDGQYSAATKEGQQLIAHELTHTIQQQGFAGAPAPLEIDAPGSAQEREAEQASTAVLSGNKHLSHASQSAASPMVSRADPDAVGFTIREGLVDRSGAAFRSGVQFFPPTLTDTVVGPVTVQGGLQSGGADRLHVIIGENMTIRHLARILLPLWTTATPFTPAGAAAPLPLDIITEEELAKGLLMYNDTYLPVPAMTNWRAGLRFPLPIELNGTVGTLHPLQIKGLAGTFDPRNAALLDRQAPGAAAGPPGRSIPQEVTAFLAAEPSALGRGIALMARALTNTQAELPFIQEAFRQTAGPAAFDMALGFMHDLVNREVAVLAAQRDGNAILTEIRNALAAAPAAPTADQQQNLTRANTMLAAAAPAPALAPPRAARNRAEKTVTIDTLQLEGSTKNIATDFAVANAIYSQCNIRVVQGVNAGPPQPPGPTTRTLLGGDTDLRSANSCGSPSAEETRMIRDGSAAAGFNARFRAFYVATFSGINAAAYACRAGLSPHPLLRNTLILKNTADTATLAHELGHILFNSPHTAAPTLMDPTPTGANTQVPAISDAHCTQAYNSV